MQLERHVADVSGQVRLEDASSYDPDEFEPPSSPGQLRPFFSLKSALYVGEFCPSAASAAPTADGDAAEADAEGETSIRVAVKFWLCRDESVENEVRTRPGA